jgi:glycosyltransferase involved in cell wall biosynthesis
MNSSNKYLLDITVVITCHNEEAFIIDTLETAVKALEQAGVSYEIILINDVSRDASVQRIKEFLCLHPLLPVTLKDNERNRGLANNYVEGAFLGRGKYYHLVCGDNAVPMQDLAHIYKHIGKADIIAPYQIQREIVGKGQIRRRLSEVFTFLVNLFSGYNLKYYNGSAVHLRYNVMRWHPTSYGFGFQADIVTTLLDQGASYTQVYCSGIDRKGSGSSALTLRNFLSVCHTLLEILIRRVRRFLYGKEWPRPVEVPVQDEENSA